jgi:hypothetical protein
LYELGVVVVIIVCHQPLSTYKKIQEIYYDKSYGREALGAQSFNEFIDLVEHSGDDPCQFHSNSYRH